MPEKFEPGKGYIFRKALLEKDVRMQNKADWDDPDNWAHEVDGKKVTFLSPTLSKCGRFWIIPEWCEEELREGEAK